MSLKGRGLRTVSSKVVCCGKASGLYPMRSVVCWGRGSLWLYEVKLQVPKRLKKKKNTPGLKKVTPPPHERTVMFPSSSPLLPLAHTHRTASWLSMCVCVCVALMDEYSEHKINRMDGATERRRSLSFLFKDCCWSGRGGAGLTGRGFVY